MINELISMATFFNFFSYYVVISVHIPNLCYNCLIYTDHKLFPNINGYNKISFLKNILILCHLEGIKIITNPSYTA